jgi:hypothetical protein
VKRSPDPYERDVSNRRVAKDAGIVEGEIDQILADSFPASDVPSWTLGVMPARPESVHRPERHAAALSGQEVSSDDDQEDPVRNRPHEGKP